MIDAISFLWDALLECGFSMWMRGIIVVIMLCCFLLIREYGKAFLIHLIHRRNLTSLVVAVMFSCVFVVLYYTGILENFPPAIQLILLSLYGLYIVSVLISVKRPILFSWFYLKRHQTWLNQGRAHEHKEFLHKCPWYFLDANEKIAYEMMKGKYLHTLGNIRGACDVMMGVDSRLLYPEEESERTFQVAMMLLQLGNIPKSSQMADSLCESNPAAYGYLKSFLSEQQGDLEEAWHYAVNGEHALDTKRKDAHFASMLYNQLGRVSCFRGNITQMFHYYRLALEYAKQCGDIRLLHPAYQNLLNQVQMQGMYTEETDLLMREYAEAVAVTSQNNIIEMQNFLIALTRQRGDNHAEYNEIMRGYRDLHKSSDLSEQCLAEVSALNMIKNGGYDPGPVLEDVERHFDTYFSLPLPARFIVLQSLPRLDNLTPEQEELYEKWTPRLIEYAEERAMADLALYEKQLSSDCVNERCWVMLQRIDFLRRGTMYYDGRKVLQWMEEIKRIHQESGQLSAEMTAELQIVKQYHEMILLQQLEADQETFGHMREYLADAYKKAKQLPTLLICADLIDIAYFGLILEEVDLAREAIDRFRNAKQSPRHFSSEVQHNLEVVEQYFSDVSQK